MSKNIFHQLKAKPIVDRQARINEINIELAGCEQVIKKYGESLRQIKSDLADIEGYMREIGAERDRLMGGQVNDN